MLGMRETLREQMVMTMAKKTLVRRAWKKAGLSGDELDTLLDGVTQPMLVQTENLKTPHDPSNDYGKIGIHRS